MAETTTITPTRTRPNTDPQTSPAKRYDPEPYHCPAQWVRTVRRLQ